MLAYLKGSSNKRTAFYPKPLTLCKKLFALEITCLVVISF